MSAKCPKSNRLLHTRRHDICSNTSEKHVLAIQVWTALDLILHWHVAFAPTPRTSQGAEISCFTGIICLVPPLHAGIQVQFWTRFKNSQKLSSFAENTYQVCKTILRLFYADGISQILPVLSTKIQMRRTLRIRVSEEAWQVRISCIHVQRTWNCISQAQCHRQACFYHRHF